MIRSQSKANHGIILLVVLSMLTFFSLLTAAYLVFSNQSRQSSFAIASRNVKQAHPSAILDSALMTLIRGTDDPLDPFFGEDLLSDFYGRSDFMGLIVRAGTTPTLSNGFIRLSIDEDISVSGGQSPSLRELNDLYAGRIITFTSGDFADRSFRVLRSISTASGSHDLVFQTHSDLGTSVPSGNDKIWMNGVPRNSPGVGFNGTNVEGTVGGANGMTKSGLPYTQRNPALSQSGMTTTTAPTPVGIQSLPVALQPNHLGNVSKDVLVQNGSDFDEGYDAADFNNWFLSHRLDATTVIPSFHRPSVINYLLNEDPVWSSGDDNVRYMNLVASLARGTMRPLPIARNQFTPAATDPPADHDDTSTYSLPINGRFTGGNSSFALRAPLLLREGSQSRLNQLAEALINGPWDVDNDFDGIPDSVWVDFGLPMFTSPEGKLIKPLIAPMIQDLSGRLNVNAHGNYALINQGVGVSEEVTEWAGTPSGADSFVFRGLGYGPADINIPGTASQRFPILNARYRPTSGSASNVPGQAGVDALGVLTKGWQPAVLTGNGVYATSIDPYGRGGYGLSLSGDLVPANDGNVATISPTDIGENLADDPATTAITEPSTNELTDNPYEFDPTGRLAGDNRYTEDELEAIIRANEFDSELLPSRLTTLLQPLIAASSGIRNAITTVGVSDDSPPLRVTGTASAYDALRSALETINGGTTLSNAQLKDLIAPELRLARRLDLNRRIGNGVDDNSNGVVDEPREVNVAGYDDDGNGTVDDASESVGVETQAFRSYAGDSVDANFTGVAPDYLRDSTSKLPARQQLARHLYVLMMLISNDLRNQFPGYGDTLATAVPVSDREAYRARRLAQWAVNVVDYRDPDAIMTRFPYDVNPFDGWAIAEDTNGNGALDTGEIFGTSATPPTTFSPVVWGVEQPELLFTESYATHDIRVRDTDLDTENKKGNMAPDTDDDTDQVRIPQGSLFLELYCPRRRVSLPSANPNTAGIPRELYDVNTTGANVTYSLDLERTVTTYFDGTTWGDTSTTAAQVPIWRIAISEPHFDTGTAARNPTGTGNSPIELRASLPDTLSFQPELGEPNSLDELNTAVHNLSLQRFVFFNDYANVAALQNAIAPIPDMTQPASVFFNRSGVTGSLEAEQYLNLAPRIETRLGSQVFAAGPTAPSEQGFKINNAAPSVGLIQYDQTGAVLTPSTTATIQPGLGLAISSFEPGDWTNAGTTAPNGIGLNVSEPLPINPGDYYVEPTNRYIADPDYPATDAYAELDASGTLVAGAVRDQPEDMRVNGPIRQLTQAFAPSPASVVDPMIGSVSNYRTAFLQRLADPTRGFHPTLNPYRTVDQIAIDLTVFSGEETPTNVTKAGNAPSTQTVERNYYLGSRQRDGVGVNGVGSNVLYSYSTQLPATVGTMTVATDYFDVGTDVETTFNYLNAGFGSPQTTPVRGRPAAPFAKHPWLNRPFATSHELMMVPACSAGRLFEEFSVVDSGTPDPAIFPEGGTTTGDPAYASIFISPFRHLLNFFNSKNIKASSPLDAAEFGSLFDFVGTGSHFRGESEAVLPSRITGTPLASLYSAPYNFIEDNRRFGKINLNTIQEFEVWKGLMQGHMNTGEFNAVTGAGNQDQLSFNSFLETRRGYIPPGTTPKPTVLLSDASTPVNYDPARLDPRFPTQFAGVFRRSVEANFSPLLRNLVTTTADDSKDLRRRNVNSGLLRGDGTLDNQESGMSGNPTHVSMFVRESTQAPQQGATNLFQDRNKNSFLRYQTLMRMPNLVSENSQTFEVRLTLGFFEVDASNINNIGVEYNEERGENRRYHALFLIDRSIPVGFIPGRDVNARDTVIFERFFQ